MLSALGVGLFATFASSSGSPFQPVLPARGGPGGPFHRLADSLGFDRLSGAWLVATGVLITVFCVAGFLLLLRLG